VLRWHASPVVQWYRSAGLPADIGHSTGAHQLAGTAKDAQAREGGGAYGGELTVPSCCHDSYAHLNMHLD
jgi:hypothetical protein